MKFSGASVKISQQQQQQQQAATGEEEEEQGSTNADAAEQPNDAPPPPPPPATAASSNSSSSVGVTVDPNHRKVTIVGTPEAQWKAQYLIFEKICEEEYRYVSVQKRRRYYFTDGQSLSVIATKRCNFKKLNNLNFYCKSDCVE